MAKKKEVVLCKVEPLPKRWMTQEEAGVYLGFGERTFWLKLRNQGEIAWSRLGKHIIYSVKQLDELVERHRESVKRF